MACSSRSLAPTGTAMPPMGIWQPPPSAVTSARSASSAREASSLLTRATASRVARVIGAYLDGDDALPRRGHALLDRHRGRDARAETEPAQSCRGEHQQIVVAGVELAEPRVEIPAHVQELGGGKPLPQLRDPPHAAGADARHRQAAGLWTLDLWTMTGSTSASLGSSRSSTARHLEPVGKHRRHVLAAVHGEIDVAAEQRILDFLHEQPLAADVRQRRFLQAVARRLDDDDLAGADRRPTECARPRAWPETARADFLGCRDEALSLCGFLRAGRWSARPGGGQRASRLPARRRRGRTAGSARRCMPRRCRRRKPTSAARSG